MQSPDYATAPPPYVPEISSGNPYARPNNYSQSRASHDYVAPFHPQYRTAANQMEPGRRIKYIVYEDSTAEDKAYKLTQQYQAPLQHVGPSSAARYPGQETAPHSQYPALQTSFYDAPAEADPTDQEVVSQALQFVRNAAPAPSYIPQLRRPIAIPQIAKGLGQAFTRAWAPELESHGITRDEFLQFIDGLNVISTASPPLQILDLAGGIIGMVPYHWAALAGMAIQATAKLGSAAVSKGRTEMYLKEANTSFFEPRKLKVQIASRDAVGSVLRLPRELPVLGLLTNETMSLSSLERSLMVVRPYCSPLDLNVPPPTQQTTTLAKMSARQVERLGKKNEKKDMKKREKSLRKAEKREREHKEPKDKRDKEEERARKIMWILIESI